MALIAGLVDELPASVCCGLCHLGGVLDRGEMLEGAILGYRRHFEESRVG